MASIIFKIDTTEILVSIAFNFNPDKQEDREMEIVNIKNDI